MNLDLSINLCRLCSKHNNNAIEMWIKVENYIDWGNLIEKHFNISWTTNKLTNNCNICEECVGFLRQLHTFSEIVQRTGLMFSEISNYVTQITSDEIIQLRQKYNLNQEDIIDIKEEDPINFETEGEQNFETIVFKDELYVAAENYLGEQEENEIMNCDDDAADDDSVISDPDRPVESNSDNDDLPLIRRKKFRCRFCKRRFTHKRIYVRHLKSLVCRTDQFFECTYCDKSFPLKSLLRSHIRNHLPKELRKQYHCKICDKNLYSNRRFLMHMRTMHSKDKKTAEQDKTQDVESEIALEETVVPFECKICNKIFVKQIYFDKHVASKVCHPDEPEECKICLKKFPTREKIRLHMRNHLPTEDRMKHRCKHCDRTFPTKPRMIHHMKSVHINEDEDHILAAELPHFVCERCKKVFVKKCYYERHIEEFCRPDQDFLCETCSKTFPTKNRLRAHLHSHVPTELRTKYSCDQCDQIFNSKRRATLHFKRVHLAIKSYVCEVCGKASADSKDFADHRATHSEERAFQCPQCPQRFKTRYVLRNHVNNTHSLIKFPCTVCGSEFNSSKNLTRHSVMHSDEKNFKCEECGEAFKRPNTLKLHLLKHSDHRPFECRFCPAAFKMKQSAQIHERNVHKLIVETETKLLEMGSELKE